VNFIVVVVIIVAVAGGHAAQAITGNNSLWVYLAGGLMGAIPLLIWFFRRKDDF